MRNIFARETWYHILFDQETNAVLTMSRRRDVIISLNDCTKDTFAAFSVNNPNYRNSFWRGFFLASEEPRNYPRWTWNYSRRTCTRTKENVLSRNLFGRSRLIDAQREIIGSMMQILAADRMSFSKNILYQDVIYSLKKNQATEFRNFGYDEKCIMDYPFIVQYADFANLSMRQAADDIIFQAQLYENRLLRNEELRLKYFNAVKNMQVPQEGLVLLKDLKRELYGNSLE